MKKILYISLSTSMLSYLLVSFVKWDLTWVTEIPNYHFSVRAMIVLLLGVKLIIDVGVLPQILTTTK